MITTFRDVDMKMLRLVARIFDLVSALSPRVRGGRAFRRDTTMMLQHP
ncbi:hypothetical protein PAJL_1806 [Cutibacterium acnes HL042PA3]|nr:hypothetical protein PAJL_1806 [Cutibacterium acnes HL042PA3]